MFETLDTLELLAMFETAAAQAQAEYNEERDLREAFEYAAAKATAADAIANR